ncbi:phosphate acyltransferase PlsX [Candidatus Tachikawaea gelatinosa]|uniref:Phosphate acyltransferase n=1 Tax=Candidatus Tachikawaea gelatinosa TaxID=1410383 RepID=A0A090ASG5_9ENTR|nr:phosphate acyltransferase PlsX [Candidatus Tachikawaea gelatinosa]BAP58805.1 phosphate acyltransferase [Candidatus Tachikawaea gelatinosa]
MTYLTLSIDGMSGDFGPKVIVPAIIQSLKLNPKFIVFLIGDCNIINSLINKEDYHLLKRLKLIQSNTVLSSDISLSEAIFNSKGSSMRIALELVRDGKAQACVSAGNTAILLGLSKLLIKPLKGIHRPALATILPAIIGNIIILDLGANIISDTKMLVQFAIMGSIMAETVLNISYPRVALLNVGNEEKKGLANIRNASKILKNLSNINYIGYIEGNDIFAKKTDVVVCDGFVGNITLKTIEGISQIFFTFIKNSKSLMPYEFNFLESLTRKKIISNFSCFNTDQYNGAYLLGLNKPVIKSHGSANQKAFAIAIKYAAKSILFKIPEKISNKIYKANIPYLG